MKKKIIVIVTAIFLTAVTLFGLFGCGEKKKEEGSLPTLEFNEKRIELILGDTKQLTLGALEDGESVSYTSNDENVATVSAEGLVEGKGIGAAVVKATTSLGRSALAQINVHDPEFYPVPYISVAQEALRLFVGERFALSCSFTYLEQTLDVAIDVQSEDSAVAVVENGEVVAVGAGTTDIVLRATSAYGDAVRKVKVTVTEKEAQFAPSFLGKDVYAGNPIELEIYVNENGEIKTVENVVFSVTDTDVATLEGNLLIPQSGGDTTVVSTFEYGGQSHKIEVSLHVYGLHTCTFRFADGSVDHVVEAVYGDKIPLTVENAEGDPEYGKAVKAWYAEGKALEDEFFVMPDKDVELSVRFINETEDDFTSRFTEGHLLNDLSAKVEYIEETHADTMGGVSDFSGYVKLTAPNWGSLVYNFDETVTVNALSTVSIKMYVPIPSVLLYFGVGSSEKFDANDPTKRYEAGLAPHATGDVPFKAVEYERWTVLEMPLSAFADIGEKIDGISICVSSNSYVLIDYISVYYGLAANDVAYMDKMLYQAVTAEENGSIAQVEAINVYREWSLGLTAAEKASETHQAKVAAINALIDEYFPTGIDMSYTNKAEVAVDGTKIGVADYRALATGAVHTDKYASRVYTYTNLAQFLAADKEYTATFTLPEFNYNAYGEAYFGFCAATAAGDATVKINGKTFTINVEEGYVYGKVIVKGGKLTIIGDDEKNLNKVLLETSLSEGVLNGSESLVIEWSTAGWSQVEITEMYAVTYVNKVE